MGELLVAVNCVASCCHALLTVILRAGPSALDAISAGCMYINPRYPTPVKGFHTSKHAYLDST